MDFDDKDLLALLTDIYLGDVDTEDLPEDLYYAIADALKEALYEGFGGTLEDFENGQELDLLKELRDNIYRFSGAKTYQQISDICDALQGEDGKIRDWDSFKDKATEIFDTYNDRWLQSEYDTAVAQATNAQTWTRIQDEKEDLPMLTYSTFGAGPGAGEECDICGPLEGLSAPVDDPVWNTIAPPNHFNCKCVLMQGTDEVKESADKVEQFDKAEENMDDTFKMNPGKDGYIFKEGEDGHPYFDVAPKDEARLENNFGLPIPETDNDE